MNVIYKAVRFTFLIVYKNTQTILHCKAWSFSVFLTFNQIKAFVLYFKKNEGFGSYKIVLIKKSVFALTINNVYVIGFSRLA